MVARSKTGRLAPQLLSFDVFGTLIDVRDSSYPAFKSILRDAGGLHVDVKAFWEHWEERNIAHYWEPYRRYRDICEQSLAMTPLRREFDLVCTAERARGYKPDGTLFRYLMANAGCPPEEIFHSGQSQSTDLVGAKPLGLMVAWINRRSVALYDSVPRPDFVLSDIASLLALVEMRPQETLP